jgi:ABC-type transport system substrate-binding protein
MRTRQGSDIQEKTLFGVAGYWQRIGLGVETIVFPAQRATDREWRATRPGFEVVAQPSGVEALARFHGTEAPVATNRYRGENRSRYQSAEFDGLVDRAFATVAERERADVLRAAINRMTNDVAVFGIYYNLFPSMINRRLVNITGRNPTWNAHEWDVQ